MNTTITSKEKLIQVLRGPQFNRDHGSLFDRGSADSYYGRPHDPHYYPQGTGRGVKVVDLNPAEIAEYMAGYEHNEKSGDRKDYS